MTEWILMRSTIHWKVTTPHRSMVKCAGDWQERASTQLDTCKGYVSKAAIARMEQGVAGRVHVSTFRPWLAREMKKRRLHTATGAVNPQRAQKDKRRVATSQLATKAARDNTEGMGKGHEGTVRMHNLIDRVTFAGRAVWQPDRGQVLGDHQVSHT